jgi:HAD superfamily hydrolase (TIGR01509 family)
VKDYDAYLFDWDGTLAMTHAIALQITRTQLERYDIRLTDKQIVDKIFGRYGEGMREVGVPEHDMEALGKEIHAALKQQMPSAALYPGAEEVLKRLRANGRKLALITATWREIIDLTIARHGLIELFDVVITGDEMKAQKPDPGSILTALTSLDIAPDRAIMLGDSKKDILAGHNAGTDTLLFYPPEHDTQHDIADLRASNPTYTIHSWQEFLDRLQ